MIVCAQIRGDLRQGDKVVDTVTGSWLQWVEWDKGGKSKRVWEVSKSAIRSPIMVPNPLPSDGRYREDLQKLKVRTHDGKQTSISTWV